MIRREAIAGIILGLMLGVVVTLLGLLPAGQCRSGFNRRGESGGYLGPGFHRWGNSADSVPEFLALILL